MSNGVDEAYFEVLRNVLKNGRRKGDRTGTGTVAVFGAMMKVSAHPSRFPVFTTKKMFFRGVAEELAWFISGSSNIRPLLQAGVGIWTDDAYKKYVRTPERNLLQGDGRIVLGLEGSEVEHHSKEEFVERIKDDEMFAARWGDLGPVYGKKWRNFGGVDQLRDVSTVLQTNPDSRRMLVSAWDPPDVPRMTLPPCHYAWQVQSEVLGETERRTLFEAGADERREMPDDFPTRRLNLAFSMRSVDCFLGMPFDVVSYSLLLNLIANEVGMVPGEVTAFFGDCHIYLNHLPYVEELLERDPNLHPYPRLETFERSLFEFRASDARLEGYTSYPNWKGVPLST